MQTPKFNGTSGLSGWSSQVKFKSFQCKWSVSVGLGRVLNSKVDIPYDLHLKHILKGLQGMYSERFLYYSYYCCFLYLQHYCLYTQAVHSLTYALSVHNHTWLC